MIHLQTRTLPVISAANHEMKFFSQTSSAALSRRQLLQLGLGGLSAASSMSAAAQAASTPASPLPDSTSVSAQQWNAIRAQLVLNPQLAYFDTAGIGPATRAVLVAEYRALEALHTDPQEFLASRYNAQAVQQFCSRVAGWLGCSRDEVTFTSGAQAGMELFANWFNFSAPLQAGDELVICEQLSSAATEFWTRRGQQRGMAVKTLILPSPLTSDAQAIDVLTAGLDQRSRILVVPQVQYGDGARLPVREICALARERKVLSIVDGSLSLGAISVSVADMGCDVFTGSFCHWLNGPRHTGVLYVRSELLSQMPYLSGSIAATLDLNLASWPALVARLPQHFLNYAPQFQALPLALSLQENLGANTVAARIRELSSYARLQMQSLGMPLLTPVPGQMWSNVLALKANRSVAELISYLRHTDQVVAGGFRTHTGDVLRLSFHIYNSFDDIDRLLRGLKRVLHG